MYNRDKNRFKQILIAPYGTKILGEKGDLSLGKRKQKLGYHSESDTYENPEGFYSNPTLALTSWPFGRQAGW
jgi:hypothetical protein